MRFVLTSLAGALVLLGCGDNLTPQVETIEAELSCLPNLDGVVEASEMKVVVGTTAAFVQSPEGREVDLAGRLDEGGKTVFDFSSDFADDVVLDLGPLPIAGRWYEKHFVGAQFVLAADRAGTIDGVYSADEDGLWLHGTASAEEAPAAGQTLLVYAEPVQLLRYPLSPGDRYTSVGVVSEGKLLGLPYMGSDRYEVEADGIGELVLPGVRLVQAHRVRTTVSVEPAVGQGATQQVVSFIFECLGEVVRATSNVGETARDFTTANELLRVRL